MEELCRGKFGRDNGRATLSTLRTDHKERSAWGISRIYDNVRAADLQGAKRKIMPCFGADVYYKVKQQRRAITEEEQRDVRLAFTEMGYDGSAIEFDRYEEQYPSLMRLARYEQAPSPYT